MIRYALACEKDHQFESWFQSADAFDKLYAGGMLECAVCGSGDVRKKIMAPSISKLGISKPGAASPVKPADAKANAKDVGAPEVDASERPLSSPASVAEQALRELRNKIEANSEDVGRNFVTEARKIHHGEAPERSIIGEARLEEAKELADEGINVAPLPFLSNRKTN